MKINHKSVFVGLVILATLTALSCGNSSSNSKKQENKKNVIETGMLEGFPKPGKTMAKSSGNWKISYFTDEFKQPTIHPMLITTEPLSTTCELLTNDGNKETKPQMKSVMIALSVTKKGHPRITFGDNAIGFRFIHSYTIPVKLIIPGKTDSPIFHAMGADNNNNLLYLDEREDVQAITDALINNDEITLQLLQKCSGLYNDPYDRVYSININTEGFKEVYSQFVSLQNEWEKTLTTE